MAINNITRNNTVDEWRIQTNLSAAELNKLETGNYDKVSGSLNVACTAVLSITANGTPLQVSNNALFGSDISVAKNIVLGTAGAATGNLSVGGNVAIYGPGNALFVANNAVVNVNLQVTRTITTNNITANTNVTVLDTTTTEKLRVLGFANVDETLVVTGNTTVGNLITSNSVSTGTLRTTSSAVVGTTLVVTGNTTSGNLTTAGALQSETGRIVTLNVTSNTTSGNVITTSLVADNIRFAANANGAHFNATGSFVGNSSRITANSTANHFIASGSLVADSSRITNNVTVGGTSIVTGNSSAAHFNTSGSLVSDSSRVTANSTANHFIAAGSLVSDSARVANNITVGGTSSVTGNSSAAHFNTSGSLVSDSSRVTANSTANHFIAAGSLVADSSRVTANSTANHFVAAGSLVSDSARITNNVTVGGTSTVTGNSSAAHFNTSGSLVAGSSRITNSVTVGGTSTVTGNSSAAHFTTAGSIVSDSSRVTANSTANHFVAAGSLVSDSARVTSNVTSNHFVASGSLVADSTRVANNITVGGTSTVTGNSSAAHFNTTGSLVSDSVRVANNITVGGTSTVTGNSSAAHFTTSGSLVADSSRVAANSTANHFIAAGSLVSGSSRVTANSTASHFVAGNSIVSPILRSTDIAHIANNMTVGTTLQVTGNTTVGNLVTQNAVTTGTVYTSGVINANTLVVRNNAVFETKVGIGGDLEVDGNFVLSGDILYDTDSFVLSSVTPVTTAIYIGAFRGNTTSTLGTVGPNAYIRWSESSKQWQVRNVDSPTVFYKILDTNDISNSLTLTSSSTVASSAAANTLDIRIVTANTNMKNYVDVANTNLKNYVDVANTNLKSYVDVANTNMKNYVDTTVSTANTNLKNYVDVANTNMKNYVDTTVSTANTNLKNYTDSNFVKLNTGPQTIANTVTFSGDVVLQKNLTVGGTVTTINTQELNVADNEIVLNSDLPNVTLPTQDAGVMVNRGVLTNTYIRWNETIDAWTANNGPSGNEFRLANSTTYLAEGTNQYFTTTRARSSISGTTPISYDSNSGAISHASSGAVAGTYGGTTTIPVVAVNATGHVTSVSNVAIAFPAEVDTLSTVTGRGATTASDVSFTSATASTSTATGAVKVSGGVGVAGNIYAGALYDAGTRVFSRVSNTAPIAATVSANTLSISHSNSGATAGTYGGTTTVPVVAVNATGHVTSVSNVSITFPAEADTLSTVTSRGATTASDVSFTSATASTSTTTGAVKVTGGLGVAGDVYAGTVYDAGTRVFSRVSNTAPIVASVSANTVSISHASSGAVAGTYGGTTTIPVVAVNATGHVTSVSNVAISYPSESDTLSTVTGRGATTASDVSFTSATASSSTTTGAVKVTGGLGVGGNLHAAALFDAGTRVFSRISNTAPIVASVSANTVSISHANSGVTAATYGDSITVPSFAVNATGHVTSVTSTTIRSASTAQTGVVQLTDSVTSTSTSTAATPNSVKGAYDRGSLGVTNAATADTKAQNAWNTANSATSSASSAASAASTADTKAQNAWNTANGKISSVTINNGTGISGGGTGSSFTLSIGQAVSTSSSVEFEAIGVNTPAGTSGSIRATGDITAYYSDDRLKNKLGTIENALDKIEQLSGFYYEANDVAQELGYEKKREVGVSAQEVQNVLPEVVVPAPVDEKYLTVKYERMVPLIIEAIKELRKEILEIKDSINR